MLNFLKTARSSDSAADPYAAVRALRARIQTLAEKSQRLGEPARRLDQMRGQIGTARAAIPPPPLVDPAILPNLVRAQEEAAGIPQMEAAALAFEGSHAKELAAGEAARAEVIAASARLTQVQTEAIRAVVATDVGPAYAAACEAWLDAYTKFAAHCRALDVLNGYPDIGPAQSGLDWGPSFPVQVNEAAMAELKGPHDLRSRIFAAAAALVTEVKDLA
ncbi:MAG: hypothetical protein ABI859_08175 [Pseudomonadota bacterium]